jgi:hypothetical protein
MAAIFEALRWQRLWLAASSTAEKQQPPRNKPALSISSFDFSIFPL